MLPPRDQFSANIGQVRSLISLSSALDSQTTSAVDVSDIFRAAFVLGVSALDHYVHEKTLVEMLSIVHGVRPPTDAFLRFRVTMQSHGPQFNAPASAWMEEEIRSAHSVLTFQRADAIADALRLVHPDPLWPEIGKRIGLDTKSAKNTLDLIVDRRNKIAHEADCEPTGLGIKWPISDSMVGQSVDFLVDLVDAVDAIV